ncbi:MAG: plasmid stabilization protein [Actinobacteria bacterium]|nr:plasmid stabilization protein [Actinomycetota bacterium]
MAKIIYTESYIKRAKKFIGQHPEILSQYEKMLKLLELNPSHPSLRLHKLKGRLEKLYSVSVNISYMICIDFVIEEDKIIPIDIGKHDDVY